MSLAFVRIITLTLLICLLNGYIKGQAQWPPLQKISLKNRALQQNLADYANITRAKLIRVYVDKQDSLTRYQLSEVYHFDSVKRYSSFSWGRWGNCVLLFTSSHPSALNEILSISGTYSLDNLIRYARPLLPDQTIVTRLKGGIIQYETELIHGLTWEFVIKGNQELWLRTSEGFDSSDFPQLK